MKQTATLTFYFKSCIIYMRCCKMFYVYEWYNIDTGFIFYVGKGTGKRYLSTKKRNKLFKAYFELHNCKSRIIEKFELEEDAFSCEHKRILELKQNGQCTCNLDNGGTGGVNFVWTEELRQYKSEFNPMKNKEQKTRMFANNPMKQEDVAKKVALAKSRAVIIKGIEFESTKAAGLYFKRHPEQIQTWCKRGYDSDKQPCRYADEEQKEYKLKVTCSKPVIIDDKCFDSVIQAAKYLDCWSESIIRAIKKNKPFKGHICRYGNQQPSRGNSDNSTAEGSTTNG